MKRTSPRALAAALLAVATLTACSSTARTTTGQANREPQPGEQALPPGTYPWTEADVRFMSGMIPHHAQAVKMAGWAADHGENPSLRVLAERIVVAQRDEIEMMQLWLKDRRQPVPAADATHHRMVHDGVIHDMLMPGMLTDQELAQLERARGVEFDRLFLTFMIRHHEGALTMVDELFSTNGAGQDEIVFRFASDVFADQSTEIDRMQKMLAALPPAGGS